VDFTPDRNISAVKKAGPSSNKLGHRISTGGENKRAIAPTIATTRDETRTKKLCAKAQASKAPTAAKPRLLARSANPGAKATRDGNHSDCATKLGSTSDCPIANRHGMKNLNGKNPGNETSAPRGKPKIKKITKYITKMIKIKIAETRLSKKFPKSGLLCSRGSRTSDS